MERRYMIGGLSFRPLIGVTFPQPCAWEVLILLGLWGRLRGKREKAVFCGALLRKNAFQPLILLVRGKISFGRFTRGVYHILQEFDYL